MTRTSRLTDLKTARGRPKGSGKDDWSRLRQIATLIAANPALKPTTAIKRIGVTDPSVIRRLRDKFHLAEDELLTTVRRARASTSGRQTPTRGSDASSPGTPTFSPQPAQKVQTNQPALSVSPVASEPPITVPAKTNPAPFGSFAAFMGLGVRAAAVAVEQHYALYQYALRAPPIEAFLRQQLLLTELLFTATSPRRDPSMPRH
jgi:hypothetical protein